MIVEMTYKGKRVTVLRRVPTDYCPAPSSFYEGEDEAGIAVIIHANDVDAAMAGTYEDVVPKEKGESKVAQAQKIIAECGLTERKAIIALIAERLGCKVSTAATYYAKRGK